MPLNDIPNPETFEGIVKQGLTQEIERIIDEETYKAKAAVAERVSQMKTDVIATILNRFRVTQLHDPMCMGITIKFEI